MIKKTSPCIPPYIPLLYIKTGVYRGTPIFLIFDPKERLWVLVTLERLPRGGSNVYHNKCFEQKRENYQKYYTEGKLYFFILQGHVFVM